MSVTSCNSEPEKWPLQSAVIILEGLSMTEGKNHSCPEEGEEESVRSGAEWQSLPQAETKKC